MYRERAMGGNGVNPTDSSLGDNQRSRTNPAVPGRWHRAQPNQKRQDRRRPKPSGKWYVYADRSIPTPGRTPSALAQPRHHRRIKSAWPRKRRTARANRRTARGEFRRSGPRRRGPEHQIVAALTRHERSARPVQRAPKNYPGRQHTLPSCIINHVKHYECALLDTVSLT